MKKMIMMRTVRIVVTLKADVPHAPDDYFNINHLKWYRKRNVSNIHKTSQLHCKIHCWAHRRMNIFIDMKIESYSMASEYGSQFYVVFTVGPF